MNPFFQEYNTAYQSIPFSQIKEEHYLPAFQEGIKKTTEIIDNIVNNKETPNFKNTIESLEYESEILSRATYCFYNLLGANTSDQLQTLAKEIAPLLSKFRNDKILNKDLFQRIKTVYDNRDQENLGTEQKTLLEKTYKDFVRNGANLKENEKDILRKFDKELSLLSLNFSENVLQEINNYAFHITNKEDLSGLPKGIIDSAALKAKNKNKEGWIFTLNGPSLIGFLKYADKRSLRKEIHRAKVSIGNKGDDFDNQKTVKKIVRLRNHRAQLLGYANHAAFVLENQMATQVDTVNNFLKNLIDKSKPFAIQEHQELQNFANEIGGPERLEAYDISYYANKLKTKSFSFSDEEIKPYFKLENVLNGAFQVAQKLFGISFKEIDTVDKYHQDVMTFEVSDEKGEFVALFYADFFPRESKQSGAWMNSLRSQFIKEGKNIRPHIINVCNFTKPTPTEPSLLTFNEVLTLFHELGHGLHGMLSNTNYSSLSGTNVFRDFVELPSQVFENWCYEKETLDLFAFHYETGEPIPNDLIEKIRQSATFREASSMIRQLQFGTLDMAYHTTSPDELDNVMSFEKMKTAPTQIIAPLAYGCFSTSFSHIFAGGYSAGYYSYKWAEVLDADAFELFKEKGIFNRAIGEKFKECILSKGGTKHPMQLYRDFRGSEPDHTALLKRAGLLVVSEEN